jgi:hypothetical protein
MKSTRRAAFAAVIALGACALLWTLGGSDGSHQGEDPSLLVDRVWVDGQPEQLTDYVQASYFADEQPVGVFQKASAYDMRLELFTWKRDDRTISLTFPQSGKAAKLRFSIERCDDLPPFDLCLTLSDNPWGGPKRYHGMREQEDEGAKLRSLRVALRGRTVKP